MTDPTQSPTGAVHGSRPAAADEVLLQPVEAAAQLEQHGYTMSQSEVMVRGFLDATGRALLGSPTDDALIGADELAEILTAYQAGEYHAAAGRLAADHADDHAAGPAAAPDPLIFGGLMFERFTSRFITPATSTGTTPAADPPAAGLRPEPAAGAADAAEQAQQLLWQIEDFERLENIPLGVLDTDRGMDEFPDPDIGRGYQMDLEDHLLAHPWLRDDPRFAAFYPDDDQPPDTDTDTDTVEVADDEPVAADRPHGAAAADTAHGPGSPAADRAGDMLRDERRRYPVDDAVAALASTLGAEPADVAVHEHVAARWPQFGPDPHGVALDDGDLDEIARHARPDPRDDTDKPARAAAVDSDHASRPDDEGELAARIAALRERQPQWTATRGDGPRSYSTEMGDAATALGSASAADDRDPDIALGSDWRRGAEQDTGVDDVNDVDAGNCR